MKQEERARLASQCARILELLRLGRATNVQLAAISLKYTSRISDLRKMGHYIHVVGKNPRNGVTWYELQPGSISLDPERNQPERKKRGHKNRSTAKQQYSLF